MKKTMKGPTLMYLFLKKGWTLTDFSSLKPGLKEVPKTLSLKPGLKEVPKPGLKSENIPYLKEVPKPGLKYPFSPSSKLSLCLSNQPKTIIYPFWQSLSQIANLPPLL